MQEYITIPLGFLKNAKRGSPFSETDAIIDIYTMADENGGFYSTIRQLSERWGWGYKKTFSFIKKMEDGIIKESQRNHKGNTFYLINTGFFVHEGITKESQGNHKGIIKNGGASTRTTISTQDAMRKILAEWNTLSIYGIDEVSESEIMPIWYQNLTIIAKTYSVKDIIETIAKIRISNFLQGKKTSFKVTFSWFLVIQNYEKVRSGKYDNKNNQSSNTGNAYLDVISNRVNIVDTWVEDDSNGQETI